jgi:4-hydroxybenzoate polyprenyltransferase
MIHDADSVTSASSFGARWRLYLHQRFPLTLYVPVIAVFTWSTLVYATSVRGQHESPSASALAVAFVVVLLLFLQLRIADEFKDFEDDLRFRPYRPVPRGIITLRGLGWLWLIAATIQATASALLGMHVLVALIAVWAYSGLMAREFFVRDWLKAHPVAYMASHMVIIGLIVAYVAACAGVRASATPLLWLAGTSYLSFCVFEVGRKIRSPADEEEGVETYSAIWGMRRAVASWLAAMVGAGVLATFAARAMGQALPAAAVAAAIIFLAIAVAGRFLADPKPESGERFLAVSGAWLVLTFLTLGFAAWARI